MTTKNELNNYLIPDLSNIVMSYINGNSKEDYNKCMNDILEIKKSIGRLINFYEDCDKLKEMLINKSFIYIYKNSMMIDKKYLV